MDHNFAGLIAELSNGADYGGRMVIRGHAANAMGRLGDPRAAPYLVELVHDPHDRVRERALRSLVKLNVIDTPLFTDRLEDPAPIVRMLAADGLGRSEDTAAIPHLWHTLESDSHPEVRMYAAEALVELGDDTVRERIPEVVQAVSWRVRGHPRWKRLKELGTPPTQVPRC